MSAAPASASKGARLLRRLLELRFARFAMVGSSGTVLNLAVLYLSQEYLLRSSVPDTLRLPLGLALAIFVATLNNFSWNRLWTWGDRRSAARSGVRAWLRQFGKYALASWTGVALQYVLTLLLARWVHYLAANLTAIGLVAVINFLANDRWTFRPGSRG